MECECLGLCKSVWGASELGGFGLRRNEEGVEALY